MSYKPILGAVCYYEFEGDLPDFIREIQGLGLHWIEYKYDRSLLERGGTADTALVRRMLGDAGMGISVHTPFDGLNIASVNSDLRKKSVDEIKRSLDYAAETGASQVTLHGGQMASPDYSPQGWEAAQRANLESIQELCAHGLQNGVAVCLENGNAYEKEWLKIGNHHGEMKEIYRQVKENLYYTADFGHALYFSCNPSFLVNELGPDNILMSHLHDNNGLFDSHSDLGTGILDFEAFIGTMKREQWPFPVCLEMKTRDSMKKSAAKLIQAFSVCS